jgi:hypothetical protein
VTILGMKTTTTTTNKILIKYFRKLYVMKSNCSRVEGSKLNGEEQ